VRRGAALSRLAAALSEVPHGLVRGSLAARSTGSQRYQRAGPQVPRAQRLAAVSQLPTRLSPLVPDGRRGALPAARPSAVARHRAALPGHPRSAGAAAPGPLPGARARIEWGHAQLERPVAVPRAAGAPAGGSPTDRRAARPADQTVDPRPPGHL